MNVVCALAMAESLEQWKETYAEKQGASNLQYPVVFYEYGRFYAGFWKDVVSLVYGSGSGLAADEIIGETGEVPTADLAGTSLL